VLVTPPPRFSGGTGWLAILVALVGPWLWTAVLDRMLKRKR
jgi:hypothetical protein